MASICKVIQVFIYHKRLQRSYGKTIVIASVERAVCGNPVEFEPKNILLSVSQSTTLYGGTSSRFFIISVVHAFAFF
jgi:hypothetical protein